MSSCGARAQAALALIVRSLTTSNTGEHCVTVLIDRIKCYELVLLNAVMSEAASVGYPLRLAWMLVCSYRQPRRIRGFNSLSRSYTSYQGILAGCSHATTLMQVLLIRPLQRLKREFEFVVPRGLMDDVSFQWVGLQAKFAGVVFNAVT